MHSPGHEAGRAHPFVLPLRGQRRLKVLALADRGLRGFDSLLLPVELRHVNHTASTNKLILSAESSINPTISLPMADPTPTDQLVERVERLLLRYDELRRTNELLSQQVQALSAERDSLKSRLSAARSRVDALLERLPEADTKTPS
jgi:FtsZ-binding cell division protein ZapB